jgi:hypothetical protein
MNQPLSQGRSAAASNLTFRRVRGSLRLWCAGRDHTDAVATSIREEDSAGPVPRAVHSRGRAETCVAGMSAISSKRLNAVTG